MKISMDLAETTKKEAAKIAKTYDCRLTAWVEDGPGGGWPEATFTGTGANLKALYGKLYGGSADYSVFRATLKA